MDFSSEVGAPSIDKYFDVTNVRSETQTETQTVVGTADYKCVYHFGANRGSAKCYVTKPGANKATLSHGPHKDICDFQCFSMVWRTSIGKTHENVEYMNFGEGPNLDTDQFCVREMRHNVSKEITSHPISGAGIDSDDDDDGGVGGGDSGVDGVGGGDSGVDGVGGGDSSVDGVGGADSDVDDGKSGGSGADVGGGDIGSSDSGSSSDVQQNDKILSPSVDSSSVEGTVQSVGAEDDTAAKAKEEGDGDSKTGQEEDTGVQSTHVIGDVSADLQHDASTGSSNDTLFLLLCIALAISVLINVVIGGALCYGKRRDHKSKGNKSSSPLISHSITNGVENLTYTEAFRHTQTVDCQDPEANEQVRIVSDNTVLYSIPQEQHLQAVTPELNGVDHSFRTRLNTPPHLNSSGEKSSCKLTNENANRQRATNEYVACGDGGLWNSGSRRNSSTDNAGVIPTFDDECGNEYAVPRVRPEGELSFTDGSTGTAGAAGAECFYSTPVGEKWDAEEVYSEI